MAQRRSLKLPITLGVIMILLVIALTVGWVLLAVFGAQLSQTKLLYWTLLTVGTTCFVVILIGVVIYLSLSIKAINLTRRQSNFMDSITHELKSPIASLKLCIQTLNRRQVDEAERANFYRLMMDDVRRLDDLITHLLDAAKLEKPLMGEEIEEIDLLTTLENCAQAIQARYRLPSDTIRITGKSMVVNGRQVDFDMIFHNLLDNAIKYAESEPKVLVTIRSALDPRYCITEISDNGPGIPLKLRRKIFGRFVRLGVELERKKPGTGLGLYIVRTQVRRWKGQVRVSGRPDGEGTTFEVKFPRAPKRAPSSPSAEVAPPADQTDGIMPDSKPVEGELESPQTS